MWCDQAYIPAAPSCIPKQALARLLVERRLPDYVGPPEDRSGAEDCGPCCAQDVQRSVRVHSGGWEHYTKDSNGVEKKHPAEKPSANAQPGGDFSFHLV